MFQPRIALRGIRLPFRCLPALPSITPTPIRRFASVVNQSETPSEASASPSIDHSAAFAPPPTRDSTGVKLRTYTPRTPGVRHLRRPVNDHLWKGRPVHKLTFPKKGHAKGGRNNSGRVTVRHMGGGHKRRIRTVDFLRMDAGPHLVERIEYDPGRSAHIALVRNKETKKLSYIIAADGMRAGETVQSYMSGIPEDLWKSMGGTVDPGVLAARTAWRGNCLPLHMIPVGTPIFNVGLRAGKGGQLCRSAGTYATVVAKGSDSRQSELETDEIEDSETGKKHVSLRERQKQERLAQYITVRLSSGEVRLIHKDCCATVGVASNPNYHYTQLGKAGRSRWLNIRPTVRGLAMNAMDHPHGGGRGKSKGNVDPKSPWGIPVRIYLETIIQFSCVSSVDYALTLRSFRPNLDTRLARSGRSTRPSLPPVLATKASVVVDTTKPCIHIHDPFQLQASPPLSLSLFPSPRDVSCFSLYLVPLAYGMDVP